MKYENGAYTSTVTDAAILGFFREYRWMSNFYLTLITLDGLDFNSSEHACMAQKCFNPEDKLQFAVQNQLSCGEAKKLGQTIEIRQDWEDVKIYEMRRVLTAKFKQNSSLRKRLLDTGDKWLEETNYWNDTFWGVCKEKGRNELGKALMAVRQALREDTCV